MELKKIEISVPKEMAQFLLLADDEAQRKRNAMLLYPYIQDCTISHGKAAEILGMHKLDLIALYGKMGLPYLDGAEDEVEQDVQAIRRIRGKAV